MAQYISRKDHNANKYVLNLIKEKIRLLNCESEWKKRWLGHILRGESLVKEVIEGWMKEERRVSCRHKSDMIHKLRIH